MQKQTFLKKKICAFSHDAHEKEIDKVQGTSKIIFEEIVNLKNLVSSNKEDNENKVKSLTEAIDDERKKNDEHDIGQKELLKKYEEFERMFRKEIKEFNKKIVRLETSKRDLELNINNSQTEIKVCKDKITSQQKVTNEMLDKGKGFEIKVKELETNN